MKMEVGFITEGGWNLPHMVKILSAITLLVIFINGKYDFSWLLEKIQTKKGDRMDKKVYKIRVPDMTFQHCKMKIDNAL